ncbi:hypothetical protein [Campylobacter vulpis]|uniref:Indole-3-glycerol-phosphate synthase n=1 Tax=Campylobacter vulpis TaxID=1655500 RepID=A0A2G4R525_9BACT|nr:hypothetical protein [Campylobacter vulpis]MBS4236244.1 hypothetical protein [Campylobacter vulpis]MBS4241680.1 hypothetical protein [Campylobacter vulpis]MBS4253159.1 hypothetical protein [Campylobacter vulpis]MBS4269881.1 hypothetical protein [Campylobacter vulpis]MBS4276115.1 hypothetical protein [Campylobacter vulpis]
MLIFGHDLIKTPSFIFTHRNFRSEKGAIFCFEYDEKQIKEAKKQGVKFAIFVKEKDEIFLSNALGAEYLIFKDENLAKFGARAAEFYLFDSKILALVKELCHLEKYYEMGVDGVILESFIHLKS